MSLSDMVVFNDQVQTVATEVIDQYVDLFNEASLGALGIVDETHIGDFIEQASYQLINNLIQRRNAYAGNKVDDTFIKQILDVSVKVDGRVGPVVWESEQFRRLLKSQEEAGLIIGEQSALAMLQDFLNTAATSLVASFESQNRKVVGSETSVITDRRSEKISLFNLNMAASAFGDRSSAIICWLMHSKTFHDLIGEAIENKNRLFNIGNINVFDDGLGRRYVVSDIPILCEFQT